MARIPTRQDIERTRDFRTGRVIGTVDKAAVTAPGRALVGLGRAIAGVGTSISNRASQDEDFNTNRRFLEFTSEQDRLAQERRQSAEPGAYGFETQARAEYGNAAVGFLKTLKPNQRAEYDEKLFRHEERIGRRAATYEKTERTRFYGEETNKLITDIQNRMGENPEQFEELLKEGLDTFDAIPDEAMSKINRGILKKQFTKIANLQRAERAKRDNPALLIEELGGIPPGLYEMLESNGFEGFRSEAYADQKTSGGFSAWRVGIGADIVVRADGDGTPETVTRNTKNVTRADAKRTLEYIVNYREGKVAREQVGDAWRGLPVNVQHALYSVAYNFGNLPDKIAHAARSGDIEAIAKAIEARPENKARRQREAALVRSGSYGDLKVSELGPAADKWKDAFNIEERWQLIGEAENARRKEIDDEYEATVQDQFAVIREIDNDLAQIAKTGSSDSQLTFDRVEQMRGEKEALRWQENRRIATEDFVALDGLEDLTDDESAARYNQSLPEDKDDPLYAEKIERSEKVRKEYEEIKEDRIKDSAHAVRNSREVKAAARSLPEDATPEQMQQSNIDIINARQAAFDRLGIPIDARRTLTKPEAERYAAVIKNAPPPLLDEDPIDEKLARDLRAAYGDFADEALIDIIRASGTSETSRAEAIAVRDSLARMLISGVMHETEFARLDAFEEAARVEQIGIELSDDTPSTAQSAGEKGPLAGLIPLFIQSRGQDVVSPFGGKDAFANMPPGERRVAESRIIRELFAGLAPSKREIDYLEANPEAIQHFVDIHGLAEVPPDFEVPDDIKRPPPKIRPFDPEKDKARLNPNRTRSTEIVRTVQIGDEIANVPSLWWERDSGEPVDLTGLSDDALAAAASRYENETGEKFPRFQSFEEGNAAAQKRSDAGGGRAGSITGKPGKAPTGHSRDQAGKAPKGSESEESQGEAGAYMDLINDIINTVREIDADDSRITKADTLEQLQNLMGDLQSGTVTLESARDALTVLDQPSDSSSNTGKKKVPLNVDELSGAEGTSLTEAANKDEEGSRQIKNRAGVPLPRPKPGKPIPQKAMALAVEFEAEMDPFLDNVARLGFDAEKAHVVPGESFNVRAFGISRHFDDDDLKAARKRYKPLTGDMIIERDNIYVSASDLYPSVYAHEFRHRGYAILQEYLQTIGEASYGEFAKIIESKGIRRWGKKDIKDAIKAIAKGVPLRQETMVRYMDRHGSKVRADVALAAPEGVDYFESTYLQDLTVYVAGHLAPEGTKGADARTLLIPVVASHLAQIMQGK